MCLLNDLYLNLSTFLYIYLSVDQCVSQSIHFSVYLCVRWPSYLSIYPTFCVYICVRWPIYISIYLPFCISICLLANASPNLSISLYIYASVDQSISPYIHLSVHLCVCWPIHLSIYPSFCIPTRLLTNLSIYLSIFLYTYASVDQPIYLSITLIYLSSTSLRLLLLLHPPFRVLTFNPPADRGNNLTTTDPLRPSPPLERPPAPPFVQEPTSHRWNNQTVIRPSRRLWDCHHYSCY